MDFLNSLSEKAGEALFRPEVFQLFSRGLLGLTVLVILTYIIQSKRQARLLEDDKSRARQYWERQLKDYQNKNTELSKTVDSLKIQLDNQTREISSLQVQIKDGLSRKEEALRNATLAKERISDELKNAESRLLNLKNKLEFQEEGLAAIDKLKEGLKKKEDELKNEIAVKEKLADASKASQEVYNGLKEQYAELERQVDAVSQSLALEMTLHQRLKEEHGKCVKSIQPHVPAQSGLASDSQSHQPEGSGLASDSQSHQPNQPAV